MAHNPPHRIDTASLHKTAALPSDLLAEERAVTAKLSHTLQETQAEKDHLHKYSKPNHHKSSYICSLITGIMGLKAQFESGAPTHQRVFRRPWFFVDRISQPSPGCTEWLDSPLRVWDRFPDPESALDVPHLRTDRKASHDSARPSSVSIFVDEVRVRQTSKGLLRSKARLQSRIRGKGTTVRDSQSLGWKHRIQKQGSFGHNLLAQQCTDWPWANFAEATAWESRLRRCQRQVPEWGSQLSLFPGPTKLRVTRLQIRLGKVSITSKILARQVSQNGHHFVRKTSHGHSTGGPSETAWKLRQRDSITSGCSAVVCRLVGLRESSSSEIRGTGRFFKVGANLGKPQSGTARADHQNPELNSRRRGSTLLEARCLSWWTQA